MNVSNPRHYGTGASRATSRATSRGRQPADEARPSRQARRIRGLPPAARDHAQSAMAFTLTELIVVIGIIVLLIAIGLPAIGAMFASGRLENAVGTVQSTVAAARANATIPFVVPGGDYAGAAALFLEGEIRIVRHTEFDPPNTDTRSVYTDIGDPIQLHPDINVAAISRSGTGESGLKLMPPPYAVRFDAGGTLIARRLSSNPEVSVHHELVNGTDGLQGNADGVQAVIGVIVYNAADLAAAEGSDITGEVAGNSAQGDWIRTNGTPLLFNRYSGVVVKEN